MNVKGRNKSAQACSLPVQHHRGGKNIDAAGGKSGNGIHRYSGHANQSVVPQRGNPDRWRAQLSSNPYPVGGCAAAAVASLNSGRLHWRRSIAPAMRNAGDSLRTPGTQSQATLSSLAQNSSKLRIPYATPQGLLSHLPR